MSLPAPAAGRKRATKPRPARRAMTSGTFATGAHSAGQQIRRARETAAESIRRRHAGLSCARGADRSEEHTSELQSLMRISYAVFCLKKKKYPDDTPMNDTQTD